jgi:hypothetical protein
MSITTYAELLTAVGNFYHRSGDTDFTDRIPEAIALAESDLQIRAKLVQFESTATVTITAGSGPLPTDFAGMRSDYWDGDTETALSYITPDRFDKLRNNSGTGQFYTVSGSTIRTVPQSDGSLVMTYLAKFTPLTVTDTTNSLLTNHPDAYLYGVLAHMAVFSFDWDTAQKYSALFERAVGLIKRNNQDRKYAGPLQVRPC